MRTWQSRLLPAALAVGAALVLLTSSLAASSAADASSPPSLTPLGVLHGQTRPVLPVGSVRLGPLPAAKRLSLDVVLRLPDPAAVQQFVAAVSDRSSPLFHHFLRRGQFGRIFGPSLSTVGAVESVLRREGLTVTSVNRDRLAIHVRATVGTIERAFHLGIARFRLASGRVAFAATGAPKLPASVAADVEGVLGLDDVYRDHPLFARQPGHLARPRPAGLAGRFALRDAGGPQPCSGASAAASQYGSFTANELASYYAMSPLYGLGDFGQGVHVALFEQEPNLESDIAAYEACYGIATRVLYYAVDGGAGFGAGSGEAALDIEDVMGLAPDVTIDVYQAPNNSFQNVYDNYAAIVNADADQVVSTSWGECELDIEAAGGTAFFSSEQDLFAQAVAQGQTVLAAAGDTGSTGCLRDQGSPNPSSLSVLDPASQPNVVGVGGTSIGPTTETVWNDSATGDGAGGGGISNQWCMPAYQDKTAIPGVFNSLSVVDKADCGTASHDALVRQVPDVSADADPATGYTIYFTGNTGGGPNGWIAIGGTSAAAPLWAAVAALIDSSPFCAYYHSGPAGVLPQGLYDVVAGAARYIYSEPRGYEVLFDVTAGNNFYAPSGYTGGLYPATYGYDMASGLGTPVVSGLTASGQASDFYPGLAALMCWQYGRELRSVHIASVSPRSGLSRRRTRVTITGSGFLPIPYADVLEVRNAAVWANCTSTTRCTVLLPKSRPGPANLRMLVEDLTLSPPTKAARFTYRR